MMEEELLHDVRLCGEWCVDSGTHVLLSYLICWLVGWVGN